MKQPYCRYCGKAILPAKLQHAMMAALLRHRRLAAAAKNY